MWLNGKTDGIDWADVEITNGVVLRRRLRG